MRLLTSIVLAITLFVANVSAQSDTTCYKFQNIKSLKNTSVKDQGKSGTCWCFSVMSFVESELLRTGKGEYNLSEMFVVRHIYENKAERYIRMHGNIEFSAGAELNDVLDVIRNYGIVPQSVYTGFKPDESKVNHLEMDKVLKGYLDALIKPKEQTLSNVWMAGFSKILDTYLGVIPQNFTYDDKEYTPKTFAQKLDFNPDDYVLLTSFTHHPFYQKFILEIPDNWSWGGYYNVPLDEMVAVMDNALNNNYTLGWAADVSEKGFSFKNGVAVVPDLDEKSAKSADWEKSIKHPSPEKVITQEMRQEQFDNFSTTDDHGMHMVGLAKDQTGKKFYYVKNSWGTDNPLNGYFYASEAYIKLKTISILVHKDAIPKEVKNKLKDLK